MLATIEKTQNISTAKSAATIACLESVQKNCGGVRALRSVDFNVRNGQVVALLRPNGAAKTTAVKLPLGLIPPDAGKVPLFGGDPANPENRIRDCAMLQVVFSNPPRLICLGVGGSVSEGQRFRLSR